MNTYINRITTKGNNAYVYVNLGVLNYVESKVYTEYEAKNLYDGAIDDFDMKSEVINESNYKDFSEYKYPFVNEDGNYIFESLKRIK